MADETPREPDEAGDAIARIVEAARVWANAREARTHREVMEAYGNLVHTIKCEMPDARARAAQGVPGAARVRMMVEHEIAYIEDEIRKGVPPMTYDAMHAALTELRAWLATAADAAGEAT